LPTALNVHIIDGIRIKMVIEFVIDHHANVTMKLNLMEYAVNLPLEQPEVPASKLGGVQF
jgi:hypothetical protein